MEIIDLPKQNKDITITKAVKIVPLMFKWVLNVDKAIIWKQHLELDTTKQTASLYNRVWQMGIVA